MGTIPSTRSSVPSRLRMGVGLAGLLLGTGAEMDDLDALTPSHRILNRRTSHSHMHSYPNHTLGYAIRATLPKASTPPQVVAENYPPRRTPGTVET